MGALGGSSKLGILSSHYKSRCVLPVVGVADVWPALPSCVVIAASRLRDPDRPSDLTARCGAAAIYICSVNRETCFLLAPLSKLITHPWDRGTFLCVWLLIVYKVTNLFGSCDIASDSAQRGDIRSGKPTGITQEMGGRRPLAGHCWSGTQVTAVKDRVKTWRDGCLIYSDQNIFFTNDEGRSLEGLRPNSASCKIITTDEFLRVPKFYGRLIHTCIILGR